MTDAQLVLSDSATPLASDEGLLAWLQALANVPADRHLVVARRVPCALTLHGRVDLPSPQPSEVLAAVASTDRPLIFDTAWPGDDFARCGTVRPAAPDGVRHPVVAREEARAQRRVGERQPYTPVRPSRPVGDDAGRTSAGRWTFRRKR